MARLTSIQCIVRHIMKSLHTFRRHSFVKCLLHCQLVLQVISMTLHAVAIARDRRTSQRELIARRILLIVHVRIHTGQVLIIVQLESVIDRSCRLIICGTHGHQSLVQVIYPVRLIV